MERGKEKAMSVFLVGLGGALGSVLAMANEPKLPLDGGVRT